MLRVTIELLHRITLAPEKLRVRNLALLALPARINSDDGFGAHVFDCFYVLQGMITCIRQHVICLQILNEFRKKY